MMQQLQFVGETRGPLNKKMNDHRDDWRHCRFEISPIIDFLYFETYYFLSHAIVCCPQHNSEWSNSVRKAHENYSFRVLNT